MVPLVCKDLKTTEIEALRFTRALFGLVPSPFLLGGVFREYLGLCQEWFIAEVEEILQSLYIDDLITGGPTIQEMQHLKESTPTIFSEAQFELHKWHSSIPAFETDMLQEDRSSEQESSYTNWERSQARQSY